MYLIRFIATQNLALLEGVIISKRRELSLRIQQGLLKSSKRLGQSLVLVNKSSKPRLPSSQFADKVVMQNYRSANFSSKPVKINQNQDNTSHK